jgi:O-antigen/teichoic acid export membrane protein
VTSLLSVVFFAGLDTALARFYYEHEDATQRRRLVSTVFYSVMSFTLIAVSIMLAVSRPLALWLYGDPHYILYLRLALLAMPLMMANGVQLIVLRLERRVRAFNLIMIGNLVAASAIRIAHSVVKVNTAGMLGRIIAGNLATLSRDAH